MFEFLSYSFVQRGLVAGTFVAVACALLGVFLVLKRLSLIGDGMSHVCLTGGRFPPAKPYCVPYC